MKIKQVSKLCGQLVRWVLRRGDSYWIIREYIKYYEQSNRPATKLLFGPMLSQRLTDLGRRRRMVVYKVKG